MRPPGAVDAYLIDEIGKMECLCPQFIGAMRRLLEEPILVASIALRGGGIIAEVKNRPARADRGDDPGQSANPTGQIAAWVKQRTGQANTP